MARRALKPGQLPTHERVLDEAVACFAAGGFEGTSLIDIGRRLGVTAPTLLHHVGTKAKLYAAVLEHVASSLASALLGSNDTDVAGRLECFLTWSHDHPDYARMLMREMLDNRSRAGTRSYWPLTPIVAQMTEHVRAVRGGPRLEAALLTMQAIGAIAYFTTGEPTIRRVLGVDDAVDLDGPFRKVFGETLRRSLEPSARPRKH